ncbi:MAG: NADH-quinone oxidoreductase subunit NuoF [Chitinivibrionales bacterium]|nr:NADH-quinone oxidoreductase subunit NuoF [Chitinivibrionales bacterium]
MTKFTKDTFDTYRGLHPAAVSPSIKVGMSTCGLAAGAAEVYTYLRDEAKKHNCAFEVKKVGCMGMCFAEPLVEIVSGGDTPSRLYGKVDKKAAEQIFTEHVLGTRPYNQNVFSVSPVEKRIVLRNIGHIDPDNIEDYIKRDGYAALRKVLFDLKPEGVINELKVANLRGRGGAGFPTWQKWTLARKAKGSEKFVICNGDEGDPGAYMDRSVLEGDPHCVIEGMIIAAYAIGASQGYFYIRAEYPLAVERIKNALAKAREYGFLGESILGSSFSFSCDIRLGAGAFVCGEESALIASIEGKRGTPSPRPPFPTDSGLFKKPTSINNVETYANVAPILLNGGTWFAGMGIGKSTGTKVFALTGKIKHSGLVEVVMGTPLSEIIYTIGGGTYSGKRVLAVQTGGPSGGIIPESLLHTPVSYEHLIELGSFIGSGGMIVMDEDDCFVDIAKFYLGFCVEESCGKCAPCRIGGKQMLLLLERICNGTAEIEEIDMLKQIAVGMQKASLCGLGQGTPNPILSTMKHFEQEYREHIIDKRCRAHKCKGLLHYTIRQQKCVKCGLCFRSCPVKAITGNRQNGYVIEQNLCIKCGKCLEVCKFDAVAKG